MVKNANKTNSNALTYKHVDACVTTTNSLDLNLLQKLTKKIENASLSFSSSTRHEYNIKFMHEYVQEVDKLNNVMTSGYDQIFKKFLDICAKLNTQKIKEHNGVNANVLKPQSSTIDQQEQQIKKKIKKVKQVETINEHLPEPLIKQERFSTLIEPAQHELELEGDKSSAKLNKSTKIKTKKKKKSTLSRISSSSALSITKKLKTKAKKNKKKSSIITANIKQELKESGDTRAKLSSVSSTSSLVVTKKISKNPTLDSIQSTVKSIKLEPCVNEDQLSIVSHNASKLITNNVHASGKVKQMVELVEARLNATPKTTTIPVTHLGSVRANDTVNSTLAIPLPKTAQKIVNRQLLFSQNKGNIKVRIKLKYGYDFTEKMYRFNIKNLTRGL
jgi:hypothetical protein